MRRYRRIRFSTNPDVSEIERLTKDMYSPLKTATDLCVRAVNKADKLSKDYPGSQNAKDLLKALAACMKGLRDANSYRVSTLGWFREFE